MDFKKICQIFDLKFNQNKEVHNVQRIKGICLMYLILKIWVFNDTVWVYYMLFYFIFNFFLWPVIWMAAFKGLVRHFNFFSIN